MQKNVDLVWLIQISTEEKQGTENHVMFYQK